MAKIENLTVLLINGPPRSGKDTLAELIWAYNPLVHLEKFARPIKAAIPVAYGIDLQDWKNRYDTTASKDTPFPEFLGKSPRDVQIAFSENFLKPIHGKDVFGRMLVTRLSRLPSPRPPRRVVVVSDSGFHDEAKAVVDAVGANNTFLVRLHRKGCTFHGDSRGHIGLGDMGVKELDFENDSGVDVLTRFGHLVHQCIAQPRLALDDEFQSAEPDEPYYRRVSETWDSILVRHAEAERLIELDKSKEEASF